MRTVFKYGLEIGETVLFLPTRYRALAVQMQNGLPAMWVELNPNEPKNMKVVFTVYGTGHWIESITEEYVGTFQDGPFVGHVYSRLVPTSQK